MTDGFGWFMAAWVGMLIIPGLLLAVIKGMKD
jgi:hypothetical protein